MSEVESDLRATSEDLAEGAERLRAIETTKAKLPADHSRILSLSEEAKALADEIAAKASIELELAKDATGA